MIFICLSSISLLVSMIGLAILLFASFASQDERQQLNGFIYKESRKIRLRRETNESEEPVKKKPGSQFILLLQTIIIGELVGLFFLTLTKHPIKFDLLFLNAAVLLVASLGCSGLTLFNVWLKKKTNIQYREIIQIVTLFLGILLMKLSITPEVVISRSYFDMPMYFYFGTVVIALATMLFKVIRGKKAEKTDFNFSNYLILVIISGLVIGTGLLITSATFF